MRSLRALRLVSWGALALAVIAVAAVYLVRSTVQNGSLPAIEIKGQAQVGGPFTAVDQTGRRVTEKDVLARGAIVTFGWSADPDMTPAALQVLAAAVSLPVLKDRAPQAIFVSLDPARDTPERLKPYLERFNPTFVGLTGGEAEIRNLASAYKLYWKRVDDASLPGGYGIDFASLYYVMGPGGNFIGFVPYTTNVAELAEELGKLLRK